MGREEELTRQLEEYRTAKTTVLEKYEDASKATVSQKATMWDSVVPLLRAAHEGKIERNASFNVRDLQQLVYEKCLVCVLAEDRAKLEVVL